MILSDVVWISYTKPVNPAQIETDLEQAYGDIVRWAIIDVNDEKLKVCLSYIKA